MGFVVCVVAVLTMSAAFIVTVKRCIPELTATALTSVLIIALGIVCALNPEPPNARFYYSLLVIVGLLFSQAGDLSFVFGEILDGKRDTCFIAEYICSILAITFYIVLFSCFTSLSLLILMVALILILTVYLVMRTLEIPSGIDAKMALIRMSVISFLVAYAAGVIAKGINPRGCMLLIGAVLFFISNGLRYYEYLTESDGDVHRKMRLICYYSAQILYAISIWYR